MCDIDKQFPIFGAKYNFHLEGVVDCPEFLVYFPALEKLVHFLIYYYLFLKFFFKQVSKKFWIGTKNENDICRVF